MSSYIMKLLPVASHTIHIRSVYDRVFVYFTHRLFFNMALPYVAPIALFALKAAAVNNGLAKTPQMGWVCIVF
jgi:hypothetical protein